MSWESEMTNPTPPLTPATLARLRELATAATGNHVCEPLKIEEYSPGKLWLTCYCGGVLAEHSELSPDDPYWQFLVGVPPSAVLALITALEAAQQPEESKP